MSDQIPTLEEFKKAAKVGDLLSLSVTIHFDQETAISLADRFVEQDHFFLLESAAAGPGGLARYSFMGFDPLWSISHDNDRLTIKRDPGREEIQSDGRDPFKVFESEMAKFRFVVVGEGKDRIDGMDLCGMAGATGYLSYDMAQVFEPSIGPIPERRIGLPTMHFFIPRFFFVLDQLTRKLTITRHCLLSDDSIDLERLYGTEVDALKAILTKVRWPHNCPPLEVRSNPIQFDCLEGSIEKEAYFKLVNRCLQEIRKGEIFQIQIGNRLSMKLEARPFDVFRHLRILNPSPYMVFYKFGGHHIVCSSPEMMVNVNGRDVLHRPIAGTRKRTWEPKKDERMRHELQTDEKERAEHVMLVDLSRNDIGRIAEPGSVEVDELMIVEEYSHVFHLVSQVSGKLLKKLSAYDAMVASFPNGTVSGAPKIRAMQLINELEPCAREFYAGSLGIFNFHGNLKSTILIRTIYIKDGWAATQASAGIVYDSVAESEWLETRNKMKACLVAMQNTQ